MPKKTAPGTLAPLPQDASPSAIQHYTERAITQALDAFEADLGGRGQLLATLLTAPDSSEQTALIGVLADPRSDTQKLGALLRAAGVTFGQLLDQLKKAGFAKAYLRTIGVIAERAPAVVEDVLLRAAPHNLPCRACKATGKVAARDESGKLQLNEPPVDCDICDGTGQVYQLPDLERQKVALDLARLLPKKAAVEVNLDQRRQLGSGTMAAMTDLIRATDDLLKTARPRPGAAAPEVIDGEMVETPAPAVTIGGQPIVLSSPADVAGDAADPGPDGRGRAIAESAD